MTSLASEVTPHLPPVNNKTNLLQFLPTTSRGKTMVEEIIMFRELVCYNRNIVFLLYISLVQEKTRSRVSTWKNMLVARPKGKFPPTKRCHKIGV